VEGAVFTLRQSGCKDLTLLHCASGYPAAAGDCNLAAIETLRQTFGCSAGWSDHSADPGVIFRAVHHWGASLVEFHLDLDGKGEEYDMGHCWLPHQIESVIQAVRLGFQADGGGEKMPAPVELPERDWRADPSDGLRPLLSTRKLWQAHSDMGRE